MVDYTCGNFPEYKVNEHVGKCFAPCPFDSEASDIRTRHLLDISVSGTLPTKVAHIGADNKHYYMQMVNTGGIWGWQCTFADCPYNLSVGTSYFHI